MSEILIVVGLKAKLGKEDELRRDLSVLVEPSRNEGGNIRYDLFEDAAEPGRFARNFAGLLDLNRPSPLCEIL